MPNFNELGRGKLGMGVAKVLNVTDMGALRSLAPEVSSVVQLPISVEELMGTGGVARWGAGFIIAAVAGNAPRFQIVNPAGSGVLVILEEVWVGASAASGWACDPGYTASAALATTHNQDYRDGRLAPRARGSVVISSGVTGVALTATVSQAAAPISTMVRMPGTPVILVPGNTYLYGADQVNINAYVTLCWRERGAAPGELAL